MVMLILPKLKIVKNEVHKPVKAKVPPKTAQSLVMKWRKLRRSSLMVTVIGDRSYKKYTASHKINRAHNWNREPN